MAENQLKIIISAQARGVRTALRGVRSGFAAINQTATRLKSTLFSVRTAIAGIGAGLVIGDALRTFMRFDDVMRSVGAIAGATADQMDQLRAAAKKMGAETQFSAQQAAEGQLWLAKAGFDVQKIISSLPHVLNLAAATMTDLGTAADITTNIMASYGKSAEDLVEVNDIIASAVTGSNIPSLQSLGEAFKYVGSIAAAFGNDFADTITALGKLHDAGIQGSLAGTALKNTFDALYDPTKEEEKLLAGLSRRLEEMTGRAFEFKDTEGDFIGFVSVISQLEQAGLQADEALKIFGLRAGPAMQALLNQGGMAMEKFNQRLTASAGVSTKVAKQQESGVGGSYRRLKAIMESLKIELFEANDAPIIGIIEDITRTIRRLRDVLADMKQDGTIGALFEDIRGGFAVGLKTAGLFVDALSVVRLAFAQLKYGVSQTFNMLFRGAELSVGNLAKALSGLARVMSEWHAAVGMDTAAAAFAKVADYADSLSSTLTELRENQQQFTKEFGEDGAKVLTQAERWHKTMLELGNAIEGAAAQSQKAADATDEQATRTEKLVGAKEKLATVEKELAALGPEQVETAQRLKEEQILLTNQIKKLTEAEAKALSKRIGMHKKSLAKARTEFEKYATEIKKLEIAIASESLAQESDLAEIRQRGMSERQVDYDNRLRAEERLKEAKRQMADAQELINATTAEEVAEREKLLTLARENAEIGLGLGKSVKDSFAAESLVKSAWGIKTALNQINMDQLVSGQENAKKKMEEFKVQVEKAVKEIKALSPVAVDVKAELDKGNVEEELNELSKDRTVTITVKKVSGDGGAAPETEGFARGGRVPGTSPHPKADNILARLTAGEYVMPVQAVKKYGVGVMEALRTRRLPKFASGGLVTPAWVTNFLEVLQEGWQSSAMALQANIRGGFRPMVGYSKPDRYYLEIEKMAARFSDPWKSPLGKQVAEYLQESGVGYHQFDFGSSGSASGIADNGLAGQLEELLGQLMKRRPNG